MAGTLLPVKYRFDCSWFKDYKKGDEFPFRLGELTDPTHPLADFVQYFLDNVRDYYSLVLPDIIGPAWNEREFLNKQAGVPQMVTLTAEEMEEKEYFGAIDRLEEYYEDFQKAINCLEEKGVSDTKWPLQSMKTTMETLTRQVQNIRNAEGEQNFKVIYLG